MPPLGRLDLDEVLGLIRTARYSVLHAPRRVAREDAAGAMGTILGELALRARRKAGHLVIFDRAEGRRREDKPFHRRESAAGYAIDVWGM